MGIIRKYSRLILFIVILLQFTVIGLFAYSDDIGKVSSSSNIVAIIAKDTDRYMLIQDSTSSNLLALPDEARYINYRNKQVYVFDKEKNYLQTLVLNHDGTDYSKFIDQGITYQDNEFSCKRKVCLIKNQDNDGTKSIQLFTTSDSDYVYLDATGYSN